MLKRDSRSKRVGLFVSEFLERSSFPGMAHGRDIRLTRNRLDVVSIENLGFIQMIRNNLQSIDDGVVDRTEQITVKSLNNHDFSALAIVNLGAVTVKQAVIGVLKFDAMAGVHGSFVENG